MHCHGEPPPPEPPPDDEPPDGPRSAARSRNRTRPRRSRSRRRCPRPPNLRQHPRGHHRSGPGSPTQDERARHHGPSRGPASPATSAGPGPRRAVRTRLRRSFRMSHMREGPYGREPAVPCRMLHRVCNYLAGAPSDSEEGVGRPGSDPVRRVGHAGQVAPVHLAGSLGRRPCRTSGDGRHRGATAREAMSATGSPWLRRSAGHGAWHADVGSALRTVGGSAGERGAARHARPRREALAETSGPTPLGGGPVTERQKSCPNALLPNSPGGLPR